MEGRDTRDNDDGSAVEGQPDEQISGSPEELYELGGRLLQEDDAQRAARVFAAAVGQRAADTEHGTTPEGAADPVRARALAGLGIARLEQAITAFREAAEFGGPDVRPLAVELLARALPLRERDDDAAQVWRWGLEDPDPEVVAAVRARLRRAFGTDGKEGSGGRGAAGPGDAGPGDAGGSAGPAAGTGAGTGPETGAGTGAPPWWDGFLESAVCHGTLPLLAYELFAALDHMYALVAVPYARGGGRSQELRDALGEAVRLPGGYTWGAELQESFRRRLREAMGADSDVLPPGWPDA